MGKLAALIITAQNLRKAFGATVALDDVSVEVGEGATGLLGPNGAGKTTLLRILLGLLPAEGAARVLGVDPMRQPLVVRERVGYMPESDCLVPGLPGIEVVTYMGRLSGMPRRAALKRAHEVLYYVGLGEARYREAGEYSVGMQQRLKLAQALVHDPDLLFLDEPTNGLDPKGRTEMLALIRELATDHRKNVLLSSHLLHDVEEICREVIVMRAGRIASRGAIEGLTGAVGNEYRVKVHGDEAKFLEALAAGGLPGVREEGCVSVALSAGAGTEGIFRAAVTAGVQIRGLHRTRRTLEDVFLAAMEGRPDARL